MDISKLHSIIAALAPIDGIDSDGKISFQAQATEVERAEAQAKLDELLAAPDVVDYLALAEAHIVKYFTAFGLMEGLKKLIAAQELGALNVIPKTVAVATWIETVKAMALVGQTDFPPSPYTFAETLAE